MEEMRIYNFDMMFLAYDYVTLYAYSSGLYDYNGNETRNVLFRLEDNSGNKNVVINRNSSIEEFYNYCDRKYKTNFSTKKEKLVKMEQSKTKI